MKMSGAEDSHEGTSSSSEEEEPFVDETDDKYFFKALSCLKNKDPKIYDPKVVFFPEDEEKGADNAEEKIQSTKKINAKPLYLRDYERDMVVKAMKEEEGGGSDSDEDDKVENEENMPYAVQQKSLKASFKAALEDSESEDEGGLLLVKEKTAQDKEREEDEYKAWLKGNKEELSDKETEQDLKPLHDFWVKPDLDPNEQFLRDYILNKRYMEEGDEVEDDGISEDGELLEMQEKFETDYNMRFENETNTEVKRYPRVIEGSVRRKNESRQKKRRERNERKKKEKDKKKDEIAKNQKQKLLEFKEQVEKIKKLTGNDQLGFNDEEIFGDKDFNPEEHDRKMQELYSDAFYSAGVGEGMKPDFSGEGDIAGWEDEEIGMELGEGDPDNMDLEAPGTSGGKISKKESRSKKKRKEKKKAFTDILDIAKPVFDPTVHSSYQKYIDEYYAMDCEDFIDDIPCRFKYREVVPNDYGLTVEEILAADDKELNQWVSAKKITKLRPDHVEKNEVKIYRKKGQDFALKKKILASVYGSPKREEDDDVIDEVKNGGADPEPSEDTAAAENATNLSKKAKKKRRLQEAEQVENDQTETSTNVEASQPVSKKKRKKTADSEAEKASSGGINKVGKPQKTAQNPNNHHLHKQNGISTKNKSGKGQNKWKKDGKRKDNDPMPGVSDDRLKAYDIKPREFKKKLKFKKQ